MAELQQAVQDVKNKNMTTYQAAEIYDIPRSTILSRVYSSVMNDKVGRPIVLGEKVEKTIADCLHIMEKHGFPLTRKEVAVLVSQFVSRNGTNTPFKNDIPGKDWLQAFQKRNGLSIKKPQSVEIARRKACDPYIVYSYFDLLESVLTELGLRDKPEQIYNLDETSICSDPVKGKVIGKKGYRSTRTTSGPGRNNTTVLLATNACGKKVPPLIIFQGKHLWTEWMFKNENIETAYAVSEKGWMQTSIFEKYLKSVFVPALGDERPVLLIYDGHASHVDLNVIQYASSEGITILKLPPHSSDVLQPLDCSTMKPLKDRWEDEIIQWQRLHIGAKLPKSEFARILTRIWDNLDQVILQNGFRKTGIYPLNRNAIREDIFDPLILQKWKNPRPDIQANNLPATTDVEEHQKKTEEHTENVMHVLQSIPTLFTTALKTINEQITNGGAIQKINEKPSSLGLSDITFDQKKACRSEGEILKALIRVNTTSKLPLPKKKYVNKLSDLNILDCKIVKPANNSKNIQPVVSFEELLLKTISKSDLPKTQKKRVTNSNAEVLTYKDVIDRMKKEKEEKEKKLIEKETRKKLSELKKNERKTISNKNKKLNKREKEQVDQKPKVIKKTRQRKVSKQQDYELDSDSSCSYISLSETEMEDNMQSFYERMICDQSSEAEHEDNVLDMDMDFEKPTVCSISTDVGASTSKGNSNPKQTPKRKFILDIDLDIPEPENKKKRVTLSTTEVLTNADVIGQMKKEKEEKKLIDTKNKNKLKEIKKNERKNISNDKKQNKREKERVDKESKVMKKTRQNKVSKQQEYEVHADPPCSYVSLSETEMENKMQNVSERIIHDQNLAAEYEDNLVDLDIDFEKPTVCSTSTDVGASTTREKPTRYSKQTPKEGKFILAKFCSSKGKKTFQYVCMIENVIQGKIVVQGFHSLNKSKNIFRIIENDHSIIDADEIIDYLPDPEVKDFDYIFLKDIDIREFK